MYWLWQFFPKGKGQSPSTNKKKTKKPEKYNNIVQFYKSYLWNILNWNWCMFVYQNHVASQADLEHQCHGVINSCVLSLHRTGVSKDRLIHESSKPKDCVTCSINVNSDSSDRKEAKLSHQWADVSQPWHTSFCGGGDPSGISNYTIVIFSTR